MVGILLITHAPLGKAFVDTANHMFSRELERIEVIDVIADQEPFEIHTMAKAAIARLNDKHGVLVLTDVMGGTPSNCCHMLSDTIRVEVVAGINLPMLLRAITYREDGLDIVVEKAISGGKTGAAHLAYCN